MNPVLKYSLALRFALTPTLYYTKHNVVYTILLLILLDIIDCNPLVLKLFPPEFAGRGCSYDSQYQLLDKSIDIIQYVVAVALLKPILPKSVFITLLILLAYRIIGMIIYHYNNNNKTYIVFIDFIKEYLALYAIFGTSISPLILLSTITLKVGFEYIMHQRHIFLDLYRVLFE